MKIAGKIWLLLLLSVPQSGLATTDDEDPSCRSEISKPLPYVGVTPSPFNIEQARLPPEQREKMLSASEAAELLLLEAERAEQADEGPRVVVEGPYAVTDEPIPPTFEVIEGSRAGDQDVIVEAPVAAERYRPDLRVVPGPDYQEPVVMAPGEINQISNHYQLNGQGGFAVPSAPKTLWLPQNDQTFGALDNPSFIDTSARASYIRSANKGALVGQDDDVLFVLDLFNQNGESALCMFTSAANVLAASMVNRRTSMSKIYKTSLALIMTLVDEYPSQFESWVLSTFGVSANSLHDGFSDPKTGGLLAPIAHGLSSIAAESDIDFEVQSVYYRDLKPNEIEQRFNAQDKLALAGVSGYVESSERQALVPMEALRHAVVVLGLDTAKRLIHISDPNNPNQHYSSRYYESDEGHIYFKSKINLFEEDTWFLLDELHFL